MPTTWIGLEDTVLSNITKAQKDMQHMVSIFAIKAVDVIEVESQVTEEWRRGSVGCGSVGSRLSYSGG